MQDEKLNSWEFWIDVGGTFTDCIGRAPGGSLQSVKILSSGITKGNIEKKINQNTITDKSKIGDPSNFYKGFNIRVINENGKLLEDNYIKDFNSEKGLFILRNPLKRKSLIGKPYELTSGEESPIIGIRWIKNLSIGEDIGPANVRLGSTKGTNALLERKGTEVVFITTKGFADVLEIGTQARPSLFSLKITKHKPLYKRVTEIKERIDANGKVIIALNIESAHKKLKSLFDNGIKSIAICFLNSIWNPYHEEIVAQMAEHIGFENISISADLTRTIKILNRGDTAVVDAYLSPLIRNYVRNLKSEIKKSSLKLMTSAGGLVSGDKMVGKDSIFSGPAGGVVGFANVANEEGFQKSIGFDMGGTSTDVSRFDGTFEYLYETEKAGVRIVAPMLAIETVAAGGGSICSFDGQRFLVGPESAGADPGPACYGNGGPLTITDINLYNGKINNNYFPFSLYVDIVEKQLDKIREEIKRVTNKEMSVEEIADGFTKVANIKMAGAIKKISYSRGYNPREYVLVAFGGAGAQHACEIARMLNINKILLHPLAGILSAYGTGIADTRLFFEKTILKTFSRTAIEDLESDFVKIEKKLYEDLLKENFKKENICLPIRMLDLRYKGEESVITVKNPRDSNYFAEFEKLHKQLYGHIHIGRELDIVNIRVELIGRVIKPKIYIKQESEKYLKADSITKAKFQTKEYEVPVYKRENLKPGDTIEGPAIVAEQFSTIAVDPGWSARMTKQFSLLLSYNTTSPKNISFSKERDPVNLELFNNIFTQIATQMGIIHQRIAISMNVKERLDFSCAILDKKGNLVVNAPHIPVHLGAMSETVKCLLKYERDLKPGEAYLTNDPELGGSHLPDLTVMTPVFDKKGEELLFFAATRAHHAEIGGVKPGSMYAFAKNLAEEGVIFRNMKIVNDGRFLDGELRKKLTESAYPSRNPIENILDINAAIAANHSGKTELLKIIDHYSQPVVHAYMKYICDAAEEKSRFVISNMKDGTYHLEDSLDDGSPICIKINIVNDRMVVDFSGSGGINSNSLNANKAVVHSAIMYCMRCLIDEDIPLNSGVLAPVEIIIPEGMLNPPPDPDPTKRAAIAAGNVEISQRIVDVFFGALEVVAASQGTMNNFIFGDETFGYYETICGGTGAGKDYDGLSAVHSHMTNTRITDVELMEHRYPVLVRKFQIRDNSGGVGKYSGGDGVIREVEFLRPLEISLITQRRLKSPFGLDGGINAKPGINILIKKKNNKKEVLQPLAQIKVEEGDILRICTPGGGGYGKIRKQ
jgi:5-oxoprolinase (ATP-hydrolysing)